MTDDLNQLDNPVWNSLAGRHRKFSVGTDLARGYDPEMSPFFGMPPRPSAEHWAAARALAPGPSPSLLHQDAELPADWSEAFHLDVVQMIAPDPIGARDPRARALGAADGAAMEELAAVAKPGPFSSKTHLFGGYYGIWIDGHLAAMAGERLKVQGWTEISAVATSPDRRGAGLASAVMRTVAAEIESRGERAFLHVVDSNPAKALYERLGFTERRHIPVRGVTYSPKSQSRPSQARRSQRDRRLVGVHEPATPHVNLRHAEPAWQG